MGKLLVSHLIFFSIYEEKMGKICDWYVSRKRG